MTNQTWSRALIVLFASALVAAATVQAQTTWYVDDDAPLDPCPGDPNCGDPDEDGSPEHPFDAIQEGIDAASNADTVLVLDGTYTGTGNKELDLGGRDIIVRSENGPASCIIDCENDGRGFYLHSQESPAARIEGFTIINGQKSSAGGQSSSGGGVYCAWSTNPTIADCILVNNTASTVGGGICVLGCSPTVINCTIAGNTAEHEGGGIYLGFCEDMMLFDCTIADNTAGDIGGGISCYDGSPTLINCALSGNSAGLFGGGMCSSFTPPPGRSGGDGHAMSGPGFSATLINCTFAGNSADDMGGGMYNKVDLTLVNCMFSGNAAASGGGLYNDYDSWCGPYAPRLTNCTFSMNSAYAGFGGGMRSATNVSPALTNCLFWGNTAYWQGDQTYGGSPAITYSDIQGGWPGQGNIDADPLFVDPDNGDFHLQSASPCIDAGCNWGVPQDIADLDNDGDTQELTPLDLDGEGRFFDDPNTLDSGCGSLSIVDMGAHEFGGTGPQPCFGDVNGDHAVNLTDLATLLANYGAYDVCEGDLDCDGDVELDDLAALLGVYGTTCE